MTSGYDHATTTTMKENKDISFVVNLLGKPLAFLSLNTVLSILFCSLQALISNILLIYFSLFSICKQNEAEWNMFRTVGLVWSSAVAGKYQILYS